MYVGSSRHIYGRWISHRRTLRSGTHHSSKLQQAWDSHGESSFEYRVLEEVEFSRLPIDLYQREQSWIDQMDSFRNGFNYLPKAGPLAGRQRSEAQGLAKSQNHWTRRFLTDEMVAEIRRRLDSGEMPGKLSKEYGIGLKTVCKINSNKSRPVSGRKFKSFKSGSRHFKAKLKDSDIPVIRQALAGGQSFNEVARRFSVGPAVIKGIAEGRLWNSVPGGAAVPERSKNKKRQIQSTLQRCNFTVDQLDNMIARREAGETLQALSREFKKSTSRLGDILAIYAARKTEGVDPFAVRTNPMAKLTDQKVTEIRRRFDSGERSQKLLAEEFGLNINTLCSIVNGKTWRHLPLCKKPGRQIGPRKKIDQPVEIE